MLGHVSTEQHDSLVGVVRLNKRACAVSLIWNTASHEKSLQAEAHESAIRVGAGLLCMYRMEGDALPQYGLGDVLLDHKAGMPALAAAVGAHSLGSLYGVWRSDEGRWVLLGIRADGSVAYDKTFTNEATTKLEFYEGLIAERWEEIVCPQSWELEGSVRAESDDLAARIGRPNVRLRTIKPDYKRFALIGLLGLGGAGVLLGAVHLASQLFQAPPPPPEPVAPAVIEPPPMPWAHQPRAAEALLACVDGLRVGSIAATQVPGWERGKGECSGGMVTYSITRAGGTPNWVEPFGKRIERSPSVGAIDGDSSSLSWALPNLPTYGEDSPGILLDEAKQYLRAHFAEAQVPLVLAPGEDTPYWRSLVYSFETNHDLKAFLPILGRLPGSLLDRVDFDPEQGHWSIRGQVYERLNPSPEF